MPNQNVIKQLRTVSSTNYFVYAEIEEHCVAEESKEQVLNKSRASESRASNANSEENLSLDEEVKPSAPFRPGVDSTNERKNFA